jgi:cell division protein FtsI (penicillin-binding protein 3)
MFKKRSRSHRYRRSSAFQEEPPSYTSNFHHRSRVWFVAAILILIVCGLIWRMVDLNVMEKHFLQAQGNARMLREINLPAYRGMITDRYGKPLAISTPVSSIWVNPQDFLITSSQLKQIANLLELPLKGLEKKIYSKKSGREFVYLKRHVLPEVVDKIKMMKLKDLHFQQEYRRYYPEGGALAHVIGVTNIDDRGQEGLELQYNDWLEGVPGRLSVVKDRLGQVVSVLNIVRKPKPGKDLVLSIDRRIQFLAYHYLQKGIEENKAESGSVVVLDVKTGEVLGMANLPTYNPNERAKAQEAGLRNRAVTDVFEPGSTIKPLSVAQALMSGKYRPDTVIDTSPGWMMLGGHRIEDEHNNKNLTVTQVLQRSSNMGITKMTLNLLPEKFWRLLKDMGFGLTTESNFPGESTGLLEARTKWEPFTFATLSFGYGMSVTALQLARAYGAIAAEGEIKPVSFLKVDQVVQGKQVIPKDIAKKIKDMMEYVTEEGGTATLAQIADYRVAGKTGTVRIVGPNGYEKHRHIGIFVGMAPIEDPRLVTVVVINDPKGKYYYGGLVAAPVFAEVMRGALRLLDVPLSDMSLVGKQEAQKPWE